MLGLGIFLATVFAIYWSLAVTTTLVLGEAAPEQARSLWGGGAGPRAALAGKLLEGRPSARELAKARALAQAALRREPVNVAAVRALGVIAAYQGNQRDAERLFRYSESLSRRDAPTQLWLIEANVTRNDIRNALLHYDRALRTSTESRALLIPILVQAAADPAIAGPLGDLLVRRPAWWRDFALPFAQQGRSPGTLAAIMRRLRLDPAEPGERLILIHAISRLVALGDHRRAYGVYRQAKRLGGGPEALVQNGGFEGNDDLPPFDWALIDQAGLAAVRQSNEQDPANQALFLIAENGRSGEVARQLLILRPGRYRLRAAIGNVPRDTLSRPVISLLCARPPPQQQQSVARLRLPQAAAAGAIFTSGAISVPAGCPAQWLTIEIGSGFDETQASPWMDAVSLSRVG